MSIKSFKIKATVSIAFIILASLMLGKWLNPLKSSKEVSSAEQFVVSNVQVKEKFGEPLELSVKGVRKGWDSRSGEYGFVIFKIQGSRDNGRLRVEWNRGTEDGSVQINRVVQTNYFGIDKELLWSSVHK